MGQNKHMPSGGRLALIIILAVLALTVTGAVLTTGAFTVNRWLADAAATKTAAVKRTADTLAFLMGKTSAPSPTQSWAMTSTAPLPSSTPIPSSTTTPTPSRSPTPTLTLLPTQGIVSTMVAETDGMILVYVPAGEFRMESAGSDSQA